MRTAEDIYDELLVYRCQDGERDAFEELFSRFNGRLLAHALSQTATGASPDDALDALQEAWLAIVRGLKRLDDPARFRPWAYRIVSNKCADAARRASRRRRAVRTLAVQAGPASPDPSGVDPAAPDQEDIHALRAALRALPAERRAILSMHYLNSMPLAEIARILAIPEGTVKSRLHTARAHLKLALEGDHHVPVPKDPVPKP